MPQFCFQVIDVTINDETNVTEISMTELPFQHLLSSRPVHQCSIVWLDMNIDKGKNPGYRHALENSEKFQGDTVVMCCKTSAEAMECLNNSVKSVLIVSGQQGSILVPKLSKLKMGENICSVIVFCGNTEIHEEWARRCPIVTEVTNDFKRVLKLTSDVLKKVKAAEI